MVYCGQCGKANPEGQRFCGQCGAALTEVPGAPTVKRAPSANTAPLTTKKPTPKIIGNRGCGCLLVGVVLLIVLGKIGSVLSPVLPAPTATARQAGGEQATANAPAAADTPVPANTATSLPVGALTLNDNRSVYVDQIGVAHVVGTVHNGTATYQSFVKVSGTFYDKAGNVLDSPFTYTSLDVVPPGQDAPYDLTSQQAQGSVTYKVDVESQEDGNYSPPSLKLSGLHDQTDTVGYEHVYGEIANQGAATTTFNKAVCTFYSKASKVVAVGFTYTSQDSIAPGQASAFDCTTTTNVSSISRYQVQVTANGG